MDRKQLKKVAIYARVSTASQTVENQFQELRAVAHRNGWQIVAELSDSGISGAKGRDQRPAFDTLLKRATRLIGPHWVVQAEC